MTIDAPFPIDPALTGITLTYRNASLIADLVLPRVGPYAQKEVKINIWTKAEQFTIPDTRVGRTSSPNEVSFTGTETPFALKDYGLDSPVPLDDIIQGAAVGKDPLGRAVMSTTDLIALDREKRVADVVFLAATYPTGNKVTLAGTDQWSDFAAAASDPVEDISVALETPLRRPNTLVFGMAVWSKLSRHPKIMKSISGSGADAGIARRQQIAELFEVQNVYVGEGWLNSAKPGQTATMVRLWGKHAAALYIDPLASGQDRPTFGLSPEYQGRVSGQMPDSKIGLRGGIRVRVGETIAEAITAADLGYFIENAVA